MNRELKDLGWTVLRFWDVDIEKDLDRCVRRVEKAVTRGLREHA